MKYKGRLDLFSNYRHNPENIDMFMSNVLNAKLGKVLAFTRSVDIIYDEDVRRSARKKNHPPYRSNHWSVSGSSSGSEELSY